MPAPGKLSQGDHDHLTSLMGHKQRRYLKIQNAYNFNIVYVKTFKIPQETNFNKVLLLIVSLNYEISRFNNDIL